MASLIYSVIASLDGYVEDGDGRFGWAAPDEEVHAFVNDLERAVGTYLYGRRMYETMVFWESPPNVARRAFGLSGLRTYLAIGREDRVLADAGEGDERKDRIERDFDPEAIRRLKAASDHHLTVGGAELASHAIEAGLVDELQLFLVPVVVGGGKRALPDAGGRVDLELLDERRFGNGTAYLRYGVAAR